MRLNLNRRKENIDKRDEEFSFHSGYNNINFSDDEDENNKSPRSRNFENENIKIQKEAVELIAKTKKMMENLDLNKVNNPITNKYFNNTLSTNLNSPKNSYRQSRSFHSPKCKPLNRSYTQLHAQTEEDNLCYKNNLTVNVNTLNQRLLEKTKQIKSLEKELKEKNALVENLHSKLDKRNEDYTKLNEILEKERSFNLKVEIAKLQKKLNSKEKKLEENKKVYENIINEHNNKITNMMSFNESSVQRIRELEDENNKLNEDNRKKNVDNQELEKIIKQLKEKYEYKQKILTETQNNLENYQSKIKVLISLIKNLYENERTKKFNENGYFNKLKYFFESESQPEFAKVRNEERAIQYL